MAHQVADDDSLKLTQSMTIEAWVLVDSFPSSGHGTILFRGDDRGGLDPYQLTVRPEGTLFFEVTSLTASTGLTASVPTGKFIHVAGTLDDETGAMWL